MDYLKKTAKKIFQYQARLVLKKYKPKIIAITGSVGKSLTKEALYLCLSKKVFIRKSEKSFTAELGIPLTIIGCSSGTGSLAQWSLNILYGFSLIIFKSKYPDWIILELDNDKSGDLKKIRSIVSPDILIINTIGQTPSHIESFYDTEIFLKEQKEFLNSLKETCTIVYNTDDLITRSLVVDLKNKKIACGKSNHPDIGVTDYQVLYGKVSKIEVPTGMSFNLKYHKHDYPVTLFQSIGIQNQYATTLAFAVAMEFGMKPKEVSTLLNKYKTLPGRMHIVSGIKDTVIIDDSYNSSPESVSEAISALDRISTTGRKIAVLGDMLELGKYSADEHRKIGENIKDKVNIIFCVGFRSGKIADVLKSNGFNLNNIFIFGESISAGKELDRVLSPGDVVLIKGSQNMRMERVVEEVMRYPEDKGRVLVRQSEEWAVRIG